MYVWENCVGDRCHGCSAITQSVNYSNVCSIFFVWATASIQPLRVEKSAASINKKIVFLHTSAYYILTFICRRPPIDLDKSQPLTDTQSQNTVLRIRKQLWACELQSKRTYILCLSTHASQVSKKNAQKMSNIYLQTMSNLTVLEMRRWRFNPSILVAMQL